MGMVKCAFVALVLICTICPDSSQAQQRTTTLIRSSLEDESIIISVDKPVYFPGDTVHLHIQRTKPVTTVAVAPILTIEGAALQAASPNSYELIVPEIVTPGQYRIFLGVLDAQGRRFVYQTDSIVEIEEYQAIEQVRNYVRMEPEAGGKNLRSAVTLSREQMRNLRVVFQRGRIRERKGPQFITIRTTVLSRDGIPKQPNERRIVTFRSHGNPERDRAMFIQYRTAYGAYAAIRREELEYVQLQVDSLANWAIVKVTIEPDYTIKIGGFDRTNTITRYFRVKGPVIEMGFNIGVPKVLYDTQASDTIEYGRTSAVLHFYYVNGTTGHRFPLNLGIGTFGVNSPIDVDVNRGGIVTPIFLDVVELVKILHIEHFKKISGGVGITPFFPLEKKPRLLFFAEISLPF